jgi:hypothetical protein
MVCGVASPAAKLPLQATAQSAASRLGRNEGLLLGVFMDASIRGAAILDHDLGQADAA